MILKSLLNFVTLSLICSLLQAINYTESIIQIKYSLGARGKYNELIISPNEILCGNNHQKLLQEKWDSLTCKLNNIPLSNLEILKVNSNQRYLDKTMTSQLIILTANSSFISPEFDHDNPPEKIEDIVDEIKSFLSSVCDF